MTESINNHAILRVVRNKDGSIRKKIGRKMKIQRKRVIHVLSVTRNDDMEIYEVGDDD